MLSGRLAAFVPSRRRLLWTFSLLVVLWLLQSALWTSRLPLSIRFVVAAVAVAAAVAPGPALVAVAFLAPLGYALVTTLWGVYPFALPEALVLAFFAGYLWSQRRQFVSPITTDDRLRLPTILFGGVVLGSCVVQLTILQTWHDYPLPYAVDLARFLRTDYMTDLPDPRPWVDGRGFLAVPALLLEGIALMRCCRRLCTDQPALTRRLTTALVAAGAVAAVLGLLEPLGAARNSHQPLWHVLTSHRWSTPAVPSINTAGPFFLLLGFLAVAGAVQARSRRWLWTIGAIMAFGGMWLTQTRSAIVAGLVVATALAVWMFGARSRRLPSTYVAAATVTVAIVVGLVIVFVNPGHILARGVQRSLLFRVRFAETGFRMLASAPLTGIGVGQYEVRYADFAAPAVLEMDPRANNAHNYLLWIAAEMGLLGLGSFLWLLVAALKESWLSLLAAPHWPRRLALAGLTAFLITWSIGQPIGIPQVAFTFWIVLGMLSAPEAGTNPRVASVQPRRWLGAAVSAMLLVVAASLPGRVQRQAADIDMSRVSYGFHDAGTAPDQGPFRWAGPELTFHMRPSIGAVEVPLAALLPTTPNGVRVRIWVDGQPAGTEWLEPQQWRTIRLSPPAPTSTYWRVEMQVTPIGVRSRTTDADRRIAVGEIRELPLERPAGQRPLAATTATVSEAPAPR